MKQKKLFYLGFAIVALLLTILIPLSICYDVIFQTSPSNMPITKRNHQPFRTIFTENGYVRGTSHYTVPYRSEYYSYLGIPYAKPPVNDLRFRAPIEADNWSAIKDAVRFGDPCIQMNDDKPIGSEDCLYLNVFVPENGATDKSMPVMVLIYGGGYSRGDAGHHGPDFLMDRQNVILVTFNYRLGPLGFLSVGTPEYSGNMGLKDQTLALKWVKSNIRYFGGDTDSITIFGYSAGTASIVLMSNKRLIWF